MRKCIRTVAGTRSPACRNTAMIQIWQISSYQMLHCVLIVLVFTQRWPSVLACLTRPTPSVGMVACQGVPSQGWLMGAPRQATSRSASMIHVRSRAMFVPLLLPPPPSALLSCNSLHDPKYSVDLRVDYCHTNTRLKLSAFDWRNQQCHLFQTIVVV